MNAAFAPPTHGPVTVIFRDSGRESRVLRLWLGPRSASNTSCGPQSFPCTGPGSQPGATAKVENYNLVTGVPLNFNQGLNWLLWLLYLIEATRWAICWRAHEARGRTGFKWEEESVTYSQVPKMITKLLDRSKKNKEIKELIVMNNPGLNPKSRRKEKNCHERYYWNNQQNLWLVYIKVLIHYEMFWHWLTVSYNYGTQCLCS